MKIVYLSSPSFADCDFPLIRQFQQQGNDVYSFLDLPCYSLKSTIINIKKQNPQFSILPAETYEEFNLFKGYLDLQKFFVINRPSKKVFHPQNILIKFKLIDQIRKINPDVIVMTSQPDMFDCLIYIFRNKLVLTVHDPFPHTGENSRRRAFFRSLAFKTIPKFVLLNGKQKDKFQKYWRLVDKQISVNRIGVYECTNLFLQKNTNKLGGKYSQNVLFFGRISPYKGIEYLLEAMKMVHKELPEVTVTIAGSGKMYFNIAPYVNLSYVDIRNRFIEMTEMVELLNRCSVVVCPYTDATQSGVVLTSYAMEKPIIATNVGAMSEYIESGKTGCLVPPRDAASLARTLIKVLSDTALLRNMSDNIKARNMSSSEGWAGIAKRYIDFFQNNIKE